MVDDEIYRVTFDLGDFRYAAATYIRLLIAAGLKREPHFLSSEELEAWELPHPRYDAYSESQLLERAAEALAILNTKYIPRCGSGGVPPTDDSTAIGRLVSEVAFFAPENGGGPLHNKWLLEKAQCERNNTSSTWPSEIDWSKLTSIRSDLNQLPHAQRTGPWSTPRPPQDWARSFGMSWDALKPLLDDQKIRNIKLTPKLYRIHQDDVPPVSR